MRKRSFAAGCFALVFTLVWAAAFAYGRPAEGILDGVVVNAKGAPVAFAEVLWQTADGREPHALRANGNGYFRIGRLNQGLYELRAEALGISSEWEHNIFVRSGRVASVTLRLTHRIPPSGSANKH